MSMRSITPQETIAAAAELWLYVVDLGFEYVYILPVWEMDRDMNRDLDRKIGVGIKHAF